MPLSTCGMLLKYSIKELLTFLFYFTIFEVNKTYLYGCDRELGWSHDSFIFSARWFFNICYMEIIYDFFIFPLNFIFYTGDMVLVRGCLGMEKFSCFWQQTCCFGNWFVMWKSTILDFQRFKTYVFLRNFYYFSNEFLIFSLEIWLWIGGAAVSKNLVVFGLNGAVLDFRLLCEYL